MKLNKQQKIAGLILAVALAALGVDKLFLGEGDAGPASAQAASITPAPTTAAPDQPATVASARNSLARDRAGLADQLRKMADENQLALSDVPNAFATPFDWFENDQQQQTTTGISTPEQARAHNFKRNHVLKVVFVSGDESIAFVNDVPLRIGDKIDDFELETVTNRSATLRSKGVKVELELLK